MSGDANGLTVDLETALDPEADGDAGVPAGAELLAFANAVELDAPLDAVDAARHRVARAIGAEGALEAAAIIAIFNGLVRVADGTGIRLDAGVFTASVEDRARLDIDRFAGAANSADVAPLGSAPTAVADLFG